MTPPSGAGSDPAGHRPVVATIDLGAIAANVAVLAELVAPTPVCAVVKADGYGHGAVEVSEAALAGGARCLAVALAGEGAELRAAGIEAPILVLSQASPAEVEDLVLAGLDATVYTAAGIDQLAAAVQRVGTDALPQPVHLKVDTGMHRVGCQPREAVELARAIEAAPGLRLASVFTHCAVADEPELDFTDRQLDRFDAVLAELDAAGIAVPAAHAANTAAAIAHPRARLDLVRCGIGTYGLAPAPALADRVSLQPALALRACVSHVKRVAAGEGISYGLRYRPERDTTIATVPIGYADGVPRALGAAGGAVLIGGCRHPIAGTVTMDQITVDVGDAPVAVGDEVVLLGTQGAATIGADEWAERLGTIAYEIVCGIGPRVPRRHIRPEEGQR